MNKFLIIFLASFLLSSCKQNQKQHKKVELKKYDENGKLIIYSEEVYAKMWTKNRKLNVNVIDTFCINQKAKAIEDIKNGKLVYFGFHPREFEKMTKILRKYGIETKEQSRRCVRLAGFEPYCYEYEMLDEINRKFGENFIDSIFKVAQKEYIIENANQKYTEYGIDLSEKYLKEKTAPNSGFAQ